MQQTGRVPADTYDAVLSRWGVRGTVELTAVIGYYTMVAQTLNAHQLPLPEGATGLRPRRFWSRCRRAATGARRDGGRLRDRPGAGRRRAGLDVPPDACDAHFHVFGPHDRFPPTAAPVYALPEATPQVAASLRKTLGCRAACWFSRRPTAAIPMPC